jgi:hypothetical protein
VLLAYVLRFPTATPVLGLILPLYLGNLWFALLVLRKPVRSLVRPLERGLRFREPTFRVHINLSLTGPF